MVKNQGINMENVRNSNRTAILSYLNTFGASSRKKIAHDLNLTTATLTIITNELINEGLIIELGEVKDKKVGRKQILIDINSKSKFCIGVELQKNKILYVITDLKANIILEKEWKFEEDNLNYEFEKILVYIEKTIKPFKKDVLGIGILVPGEIQNNYAINSPIPDIFYTLKNKFNLDCIIENNMTGLVTSELYFRKISNDFWVLKYGPGIGSSIVIDGKILKGSKEKIIELGHIQLLDKEGKGNYCSFCKKSGCLESEIHFYNIVKEFEKLGYVKSKNENSFNFIERIIQNNNCNNLFEEKLSLLICYLSLIGNLIPTQDLIICGEIFSKDKYFNFFKENLQKKCKKNTFENISFMQNYSYKRKIASSILVIEKFFKI